MSRGPETKLSLPHVPRVLRARSGVLPGDGHCIRPPARARGFIASCLLTSSPPSLLEVMGNSAPRITAFARVRSPSLTAPALPP